MLGNQVAKVELVCRFVKVFHLIRVAGTTLIRIVKMFHQFVCDYWIPKTFLFSLNLRFS